MHSHRALDIDHSAGLKRRRPAEEIAYDAPTSRSTFAAAPTPALLMPPRVRAPRRSLATSAILVLAALFCLASAESVDVAGGGAGIRGKNRHMQNNQGPAVINSDIHQLPLLPEQKTNRQLQRGHGKPKDDGYGYGSPKQKVGNKGDGDGKKTGGGWGFGFGGGGGNDNEGDGNGDEESGTGFGDDDNTQSGYGYGGGGTSSTSSGYGYGSSSSSSTGYDSGSSSYGSSSGYGSSSSSYGGSSSYGSSSYGSSSYGSSSSSSYGSSYGSSYSSGGYSHSSSYRPPGSGGLASAMKVQIPLLPVILLSIIFFPAVTLYTAYAFEHNAEGTYANFCRLQLNCMSTVYSFLYNLWHCRLGEVADVVCAMDDEDEYGKKFTDEELERMNPRKGLDRALEIEHKRAVRKERKAGRGSSGTSDVEMNRLR